MKKVTCFLPALIALALLSSPALAETEVDTSYIDVAARHCPVEWSTFTSYQPDAWASFKQLKYDPGVDPAQAAAFNKYGAWAIALADYFGAFINLPNAVPADPATFDATRAKFALTMCLMPTPQDRALIMEFVRTTKPTMTDDQLETALFEGTDRFECMRVEAASEQVFALDPHSAAFADDFNAVTQAVMRPCNG